MAQIGKILKGGHNLLNTINVNLNTDLKVTRVPELGIKIKSQDINNNLFILRFTDQGKVIELDGTYTVEILTKFEKSKSHRLTSATIYRDHARWEFDTSFITQDETVYNYVYVRKAGNLVVSADANAFAFDVGLSEIDKDAGRVAEVYDENYEKVLADYSGALDERTTERLDEAVADFNQRGDAEIVDWRVEKSGELASLQTEITKKANKQQEAWITPTLLNGATPGQNAPRYRKDEFGVVRLSGSVSDVATDRVLFVLPSGYRPRDTSSLSTLHGQHYNRYNDIIRIEALGNVRSWFLLTPTDTKNFVLDGITFVAER